MSTVYPIHKAPYTNYHDLNLDWVIEALNDFNTRLTNFVSLATIKYADPIQWNITSQYEANTVVVDSVGNAYLSVQPVPSGVSLDRTEYWTKIGNFNELWANVKKAITPIDEGHSTTATAARAIDDLVWVDVSLVRVTKAMDAGDAYVVGSNCVSSSTNEVLHYLLTTFNKRLTAEQTAREKAENGLQTAINDEKQAREEADTQLQAAIDAEQQAREEADSGLQAAIDEEQQSREEADNDLQNSIDQLEQDVSKILDYANVKSYGAKGDGSTDDTAAFSEALASGKNLYIPDGEYVITGAINIGSPLMTSGAIVVASGVTITIGAPVAPCTLHFRKTGNGKFAIENGETIADWFIDTGLANVFDGGSIANFTGTIKFPTPGTWVASVNTITTNTKYHVNGPLLIASHVTYDFCGGVVSFDTYNAQIGAIGVWGGPGPERSKVCNATFCATVETVAQFTQVFGCGRITFENLHCIGGRRVGYYKHTVNVQVRNIIHDVYYKSSAQYTSFLVDNSSDDITPQVQGNASIMFVNCISSMGTITGQSNQFIIYNANDIRDTFIYNCECSGCKFGIQISAKSIGTIAWNVFIRGYIADQVEQCIYVENFPSSMIQIDDCYFNGPRSIGIRLINSAAIIRGCQFIGSSSSTGVQIETGEGTIIDGCQFNNMDKCVSAKGTDGTIVTNCYIHRTQKYADGSNAISYWNGSKNGRVLHNICRTYGSGNAYAAMLEFTSDCTGCVVGVNSANGTELNNQESDLQKLSTVRV